LENILKFLVIGGAGYVGSHFVAEAVRQRNECVVFDNLSLGHRESLADSIDLIEGDVRDAESLTVALEKVQPDAVLHYAAKSLVGESVTNPDIYFDNNVVGMKTLLEVMNRSNSNANLIFSSSCAIFGTPESLPLTENQKKSPESPYGHTKLMCEFMISDFCRAYGLKAIALRYFNASGADAKDNIGESHSPETHLIPNILMKANRGEKLKIFGGDYPTKDGTCVRDYIHVTDLAESHLLAAKHLMKQDDGYFDAMNVGSGQGYSNLEIVKEAEKVIGRKVEYSIAPRREGDPAELFASTDKINKILNFVPNHSDLNHIIATAWKWHQNQSF
jgi:UDP-glucose-4-epimerase GalE